MKVYIVTVRPNSKERYTDSIWVDEQHAIDRAEDLCVEFKRRGGEVSRLATNNGWAAWVTTAAVTDGQLATGNPKTK